MLVYLTGMSIFRFSAEFRFYFLLSAFLEIIFRFFWKSCWQQKKKKKKLVSDADTVGRVQRVPLSGEFKELRYAGARFFQFWVKVWNDGIFTRHSKSDTRNHAPPASRKGKGRVVVKWRDGVGGGRGLEMIATEPVTVLWPSSFSICTPPIPPPLLSHIILHTHRHTLAHTCTHTLAHTCTHTLAHTHTHTHTHTYIHTHTIHSVIFTPFFSPQESVCHCLSLSLSHTHTHTHREDFSHISSLSPTHTRAQQYLLRHQSMLKIAWPETHLTSTPLLSLLSPSSPPLHNHYKQATVSSFPNNKGWAVTFVCISR